jgi:hypothetical protein
VPIIAETLDSPEFPSDATTGSARIVVQINNLNRVSRFWSSTIHYEKDRHLVIGFQGSLANLLPAYAVPSAGINHIHVSAETVFVFSHHDGQRIGPGFGICKARED